MTATGPCRVILVGMMGSGKSTIGRALAATTGWPYADNDDLVRRATGSTSRAILAERGEAAMRRAESEALALGLSLPAPVIVAAAGGTILEDDTRDRMRRGGFVVWLRADAEVLATRAPAGAHRPWLEGDAASWMREALGERAPLYASVADLTVDTDAGAVTGAVASILDALRGHAPCADQLTDASAAPPP